MRYITNEILFPKIESDFLSKYPGAITAYSTRKLNSKYTGACMDVTNTLGTTKAIGFVGENLDESALLSHAGMSGSIPKWYDQSNMFWNGIQTNTLYQPSIVENFSILRMGNSPALKFNTSLLSLSSFGSGKTDFTFIFVYKINQLASGSSLLLYFLQESLQIYPINGTSNPTRSRYIYLADNSSVLASTIFLNNNYIEIYSLKGASGASVFLNGQKTLSNGAYSQKGIVTQSSNTLGGRFDYNSGFFLKGFLCEFIAYPFAVEDYTATAMAQEINNYYRFY